MAWKVAPSYPRSLNTCRAAATIRLRVSSALAAGGRPGLRLAVGGTFKLCHYCGEALTRSAGFFRTFLLGSPQVLRSIQLLNSLRMVRSEIQAPESAVRPGSTHQSRFRGANPGW